MSTMVSENLIILQPQHKELILDFEQSRLGEGIEERIKSWDARWRAEALDHYLALSWSFGLLQNGRLAAYVLAQPFLFFRGLTQSLWIESLSAVDQAGALQMVDTVYKWARDKHFQALVFEQGQEHSNIFVESPYPVLESGGMLYVKTSKMK